MNFLNLRTGKAEISVDPILVGEAGPSEEEIDTGLAEGYHIHIEPLASSVEYGWMVEFAESVCDCLRWSGVAALGALEKKKKKKRKRQQGNGDTGRVWEHWKKGFDGTEIMAILMAITAGEKRL